ncbi:O-antigen ligase family protein [Grimontia sp. SpTr1]|uniref:O-antigen ligase family protein n=1 Tax=Grimontia sp. SpTr1 TaxID=2995319 RepID=UPI00248B85B5|nr:O-antigen ligase family protein [Grimontia sp. SpTr1]
MVKKFQDHSVLLTISEKKIEKFILSLILIQLAIDAISGFFSLYLNFTSSLSLLYKIVILLVCLIYILGRGGMASYLMLAILSYGLILLITNLFQGASLIPTDFSEYVKLITPIIIFLSVSSFKYIDPKRYIVKVVLFSSLVILINICMSLIGIGTSSYGSYGMKGFFYAANALSGVICIIAAWAFTIAIEKGRAVYVLSCFLFLLMAVAIGTKSGILAVGLLSFLLPVILRKISTGSVYYLMITSGLLLISLYYYDIIINSAIIERLVYFYDTGGLTRAILSDRNEFMDALFPYFLGLSPIDLLFGVGYSGLYHFPKPLTELDPIDIIMMFGIFTMLLYASFLFFILIKIFRLKRKFSNSINIRNLSTNAILVSIILIGMSTIAGHILFNGMTTIFWGLALSLPFWQKNYSINKRVK